MDDDGTGTDCRAIADDASQADHGADADVPGFADDYAAAEH